MEDYEFDLRFKKLFSMVLDHLIVEIVELNDYFALEMLTHRRLNKKKIEEIYNQSKKLFEIDFKWNYKTIIENIVNELATDFSFSEFFPKRKIKKEQIVLELYVIYLIFLNDDSLSNKEKRNNFFKLYMRELKHQKREFFNGYNYAFPNVGNSFIVYNDAKITIETIEKLDDFISLVNSLDKDPNIVNYYRGHSNLGYQLLPSLFREQNWLINEKQLCSDLKCKCSSDFKEIEKYIDELAKMQHYSLPTRLLDLTKSPEIALYFTCIGKQDEIGEVISFKVDKKSIKSHDEIETIQLSALSYLSFDEQKELLSMKPSKEVVTKFQNLVHKERQNFKFNPDERTFLGNVFLEPEQSNERLKRQKGAFVLFGLTSEAYSTVNARKALVYRNLNEYRFKLNAKIAVFVVKNKKTIIKELDKRGFNEASLFPEIDNVSNYLKNKYLEK